MRVVRCSLSIHSDPRLLEQMIRNLVSNALKYTKRGKVLLGCRRHEGMLSIEIWDTGIGIPDKDLQAIFEEYHQLDNPARERSRGLGLGLSIVQRLGTLLGHRVRVRSQPGKGSVFAIEVMLPPTRRHRSRRQLCSLQVIGPVKVFTALVRSWLLRTILRCASFSNLSQGRGSSRGDGAGWDNGAGHWWPRGGTARPHPCGLQPAEWHERASGGGEAAGEPWSPGSDHCPYRGHIDRHVTPYRAREHCVRLNKPVKLTELTRSFSVFLPYRNPRRSDLRRVLLNRAASPEAPIIFIVDDDSHVREGLRRCSKKTDGSLKISRLVRHFSPPTGPGSEACLIDAYLPGMDGLELLRRLRMPAISCPLS